MQARKAIIPEVVLRHKDAEAREFIYEKYLHRYRKSKLICFAWFLVLGAVGAHRIYLGQYKAAAIVFALFVLSLCLQAVLPSMMYGPSDLLVSIIYFLPFFVILAELVLMPLSYGKANEHVRQTLVEDIRLAPHIPLS